MILTKYSGRIQVVTFGQSSQPGIRYLATDKGDAASDGAESKSPRFHARETICFSGTSQPSSQTRSGVDGRGAVAWKVQA